MNNLIDFNKYVELSVICENEDSILEFLENLGEINENEDFLFELENGFRGSVPYGIFIPLVNYLNY